LATNRRPAVGPGFTAAMGLLVATILGMAVACSQNYEEGSHPAPKPPQRPAQKPASHPKATPDAGTSGALSGTIRIAPDLAGKVPQNAYLYVMARQDPDGGIPYALKRIRVPGFPYTYSLSQAEVMGMGDEGVVLSGVKELYLIARIDQDGLAGVAPGDLEGSCSLNPVSGSGKNLDILIDTVH
jgi:cytochrome c-type biogenesis protein CcmH